MFRFRLVTILCVVTFLAAWFASGSFKDYDTATGIRMNLWFILFAICVFCVIYQRNRCRAFWSGFLLALAMRALPQNWIFFNHYRPRTNLLHDFVASLVDSEANNSLYNLVASTADLAGTLVLGAVCGLIAVAVYNNANPTSSTAGEVSESDE